MHIYMITLCFFWYKSYFIFVSWLLRSFKFFNFWLKVVLIWFLIFWLNVFFILTNFREIIFILFVHKMLLRFWNKWSLFLLSWNLQWHINTDKTLFLERKDLLDILLSFWSICDRCRPNLFFQIHFSFKYIYFFFNLKFSLLWS